MTSASAPHPGELAVQHASAPLALTTSRLKVRFGIRRRKGTAFDYRRDPLTPQRDLRTRWSVSINIASARAMRPVRRHNGGLPAIHACMGAVHASGTGTLDRLAVPGRTDTSSLPPAGAALWGSLPEADEMDRAAMAEPGRMLEVVLGRTSAVAELVGTVVYIAPVEEVEDSEPDVVEGVEAGTATGTNVARPAEAARGRSDPQYMRGRQSMARRLDGAEAV